MGSMLRALRRTIKARGGKWVRKGPAKLNKINHARNLKEKNRRRRFLFG